MSFISLNLPVSTFVEIEENGEIHFINLILNGLQLPRTRTLRWMQVYIPASTKSRVVWGTLVYIPMHPKRAVNPRENELIQQLKERLASSSQHVFSITDIQSFIAQLRTECTFPQSLSDRKFQRAVIENEIFHEIILTATYPFDSKRYHWGPFSEYELALSLKPSAYLSHGTAAALHNLTGHEPTTIYVNKEQSPKNSKGNLTQSGIDRAFSSEQRQSGYIVTHQQTQIILLSGKHSNRLGVVKLTGSEGEALELTDLERTLIDIAVRPSYAGGASAVAKAYRTALPKVSVSRLTKMLEDLKYIYPYHQVVGFYLQNAGHPLPALQRLRDMGLHFDFYLEHGMKHTRFDSNWRVFCPADLDGTI